MTIAYQKTKVSWSRESYFRRNDPTVLAWCIWTLIILLQRQMALSIPFQRLFTLLIVGAFLLFFLLTCVLAAPKNTEAVFGDLIPVLPWVGMTLASLINGSFSQVQTQAWFVPILLVALLRSNKQYANLQLIENFSVSILVIGLVLWIAAPMYVTLGSTALLSSISNERFTGISNHANLIATFAFTVLLLVSTNRRRGIIFRAVAFGSSIVSIFLSESRTVWAVLIVGMLLRFNYQVLTSRSHLRFLIFYLIFLAQIFLILRLIIPLYELATIDGLSTVNGRVPIWQFVLDNWSDKPWFGHGSGIWDEILDGLVPIWAVNGHNQLIEEIYTRGLFGILSIVLAFGWLINVSIREFKIKPELIFVTVGLIAISMTRTILFEDRLGVDTLGYLLLLANYLVIRKDHKKI